jgi:hypothetical protein
MPRLSANYPTTPIPGTEKLGRYPVDGDRDARMLWLVQYQRAAADVPGFPDVDRLELEYARCTGEHALAYNKSVNDENVELRLAGDPKIIAAMVVAQVMERVGARVEMICKGIIENIQAQLLPRLTTIQAETAILPELERRQRVLASQLRLLAGERDVWQRIAAAGRAEWELDLREHEAEAERSIKMAE